MWRKLLHGHTDGYRPHLQDELTNVSTELPQRHFSWVQSNSMQRSGPSYCRFQSPPRNESGSGYLKLGILGSWAERFVRITNLRSGGTPANRSAEVQIKMENGCAQCRLKSSRFHKAKKVLIGFSGSFDPCWAKYCSVFSGHLKWWRHSEDRKFLQFASSHGEAGNLFLCYQSLQFETS